MSARSTTAGRLVRASLTLVVLLALSAAFDVASAFAGSASPTPAKDEPLVNWTWLGIGLGGVLIMLVVMFLLTRVFGRRGQKEE